MSDLKERILKILRQPQLAGLATITQDGKPWVRYVMVDMLAAIFSGPDDPNYGILEVMPYYIEYVSPGVHEPEIWKAP